MAHTTIPIWIQAREEDTCMGRTCMQWRRDGELSEGDLSLILQRLCAADAQACAFPDAVNPQVAGSHTKDHRRTPTASSDRAS